MNLYLSVLKEIKNTTLTTTLKAGCSPQEDFKTFNKADYNFVHPHTFPY